MLVLVPSDDRISEKLGVTDLDHLPSILVCCYEFELAPISKSSSFGNRTTHSFMSCQHVDLHVHVHVHTCMIVRDLPIGKLWCFGLEEPLKCSIQCHQNVVLEFAERWRTLLQAQNEWCHLMRQVAWVERHKHKSVPFQEKCTFNCVKNVMLTQDCGIVATKERAIQVFEKIRLEDSPFCTENSPGNTSLYTLQCHRFLRLYMRTLQSPDCMRAYSIEGLTQLRRFWGRESHDRRRVCSGTRFHRPDPWMENEKKVKIARRQSRED